MKLLLKDGKSVAEHAVFVIALPSYGNAGQLAVDALLSTVGNRSELIGYIESPDVLPVAGYECMYPGSQLSLCLPIEVYRILGYEGNVYVIQQRSPTVIGAQQRFCNALHTLLVDFHYDLSIVLTGASREEIETRGGTFHISSPEVRQKIEKLFPTLGISLESMGSFGGAIPHGMGLASLLWRASATTRESIVEIAGIQRPLSSLMLPLPPTSEGDMTVLVSDSVIVLGKLCNEGNNAVDGAELAVTVLRGLGVIKDLETDHVVTPASWQKLFGRDLSAEDESMFF